MHGYVCDWHGTLFCTQSEASTWLPWPGCPTHCMEHVAGVVCVPAPHVVEQPEGVPSWHWYWTQHPSVGQAVVWSTHVAPHWEVATWKPPGVCVHEARRVVEPELPHVAVHVPT